MLTDLSKKLSHTVNHHLSTGRYWVSQNLSTGVRFAIIGLVLLFSLMLGTLGETREALLILVAIVGITGLIILLRWPPLGILLLIPLSINVPFTGPGGINTAALGVAGFAGIWFIDMFIRQKKIQLAASQTLFPAIVLLVSAIVSFLVGQIPWYALIQQAPLSAQVGGLLITILSIIAFLLIGNQIRDLRWLQALVWIFICIGSLYILGRIVPPVANQIRQFFQPGATTGSLFWIWLVVLSFSQAYLNRHLHWLVRAGLFTIVIATLYVAIIQTSIWKSGYIPPLAGIAAIIALHMKKRALIFAPLAIIAAIYMGTEAVATDEYSYMTRLVAWEIVIQIAKVNPILGLGFANYYWYAPLFPILGYAISFNSHNQYVDILAQTGLVGLLVFLWFFWSIGRLGIKLHDKVPEGFARAYVYGAVGGAVGMLVASMFVDWVLPFVYNIGFNGFRASVLGWIFLGGLVSIEQITRDSAASQS